MQILEQISNFVSRYMAVFVILIAGISLVQPWTFPSNSSPQVIRPPRPPKVLG